ncbi:hypothetical protein [Mycobacterium riyadhense]|nr:hypothetical protein [Mycobacterium riyadhense]
MMFVFGIVGPIFLAMFFVSQSDPTMKWAYWAGLFITYADIQIALALTKSTGDVKAPSDIGAARAVAKRTQGNRTHGLDFDSSASSD